MFRPRLSSVAPLLMALALAGCSGSSARRDGDQPATVGAIPKSGATASTNRSSGSGGTASGVPKVGAGQRPAPPLPGDVVIDTTQTQLGAQALLAAREEVAAGLVDPATIAQRHEFIFHAWLPQMQAEQARLAGIRDQRIARERRQVAAAAAQASRKHDLDVVEERYRVEIEREKRKTVPILPDE